ncbi:MAG: hypothetical protein IIU08_07940, partial [Clostridia bacterium]|nr:hypothetical protein [Clostridia bacterium]
MKHFRPIASVLLALLMLILPLSALAGCSETAPEAPPAGTGTSPSAADPGQADGGEEKELTPAEQRMLVSDDLPETDFNGKTFTVVGSESSSGEKYIVTEEMNGEGVNDSIYKRNAAVEERFGAKIAYLEGGAHRDCATMIANSITSADAAFDLIQFHVVSNSGNAMKGLYLNWYDVPHVNFEKPWWSDSTVKDLTLNGRAFLAIGDFALTSVGSTYCMFYDKVEAVNYQIEDPYETVKAGRWTLDHLKSLCEQVYTDTNGSGAEDEEDYYGLASDQQSNYNTYLWSCDNPIFTRDSNGEIQYVYYSEHLVDVYNSCWDLLNNRAGVYSKMDHGSGMDLFSKYHTLTCNAILSGAISYLADFTHDYGIIPYPKYDEAQAEYKSMVDGGHEAMAVGKNAENLEFIGIMTEALCAESYKSVLPAYYDVCLKTRYASSPKDAEMMDLCVN